MKKKKPRQLYYKLFWSYIMIAFFIVLSLIVYFISALVRNTLRNRQETSQRICEEAADYVKADIDAVNYLYSELYREDQELRDVMAFLNLAPDEYLLKWQIRDQKAKVLRSEEAYIEVPALSSRWLDKVLLPEIDVFTEYVSYQAYDGGKEIAEGTVIFSYPKYFRYQDPELSVELQYPWLIVRAKAYAKSVEIQNEDQDMVLSDNYFDMNGGEKRVQILRGKPEGLKIRSVYDIR